MQFVYVKLPLRAGLAEREHQIHQALESALAAQSAGALVGWGRSMSDASPRGGSRTPAYHRIDVEVAVLAPALDVLRASLAGLEVPSGSELHYTVDRVPMQETFEGGLWGEPRANRR